MASTICRGGAARVKVYISFTIYIFESRKYEKIGTKVKIVNLNI